MPLIRDFFALKLYSLSSAYCLFFAVLQELQEAEWSTSRLTTTWPAIRASSRRCGYHLPEARTEFLLVHSVRGRTLGRGLWRAAVPDARTGEMDFQPKIIHANKDNAP